jgi:hypothetical protein
MDVSVGARVAVWVGTGRVASAGARLVAGTLVGTAVGAAVGGGISVSVASAVAEASGLNAAVFVGDEVGSAVEAADLAVGSTGPQPPANTSRPATTMRYTLQFLRITGSTSAF